MKKEGSSTLLYTSNKATPSADHCDPVLADEHQSISTHSINPELEEPKSSNSDAFSIIYGILSQIDRKCQYIKLQTNKTENTYYIQEFLFNPNSSIPYHQQFYTVAPLEYEGLYVAVFLDDSSKVIDVQLVKQLRLTKNTPRKYIFPDASTEQIQSKTVHSSQPEPDEPEQPDDLFPDTTEDDEQDDFLIKHPLYRTPSYVSYPELPTDYLWAKYFVTIKINSLNANPFFIDEVCRYFAQLSRGRFELFSAVTPTKMPYEKANWIKSRLGYLESIHKKALNILEYESSPKRPSKQSVAYVYFNLERGKTNTEECKRLIKAGALPKITEVYQYINDKLPEIEKELAYVQSQYDIVLKYQDEFTKQPYGELHFHGFAEDMFDVHQFNCDTEIEHSLYAKHIINIKFNFGRKFCRSGVKICVQPIDDRYGSKLASIKNLLNYIHGPRNQPTIYYGDKLFDKLNGQSVFRNVKLGAFKINTGSEHEPIYLTGKVYKPTLLRLKSSDQYPTFKLPNDPKDHTLLDFYPKLLNFVQERFPYLSQKYPNYIKPAPARAPARAINGNYPFFTGSHIILSEDSDPIPVLFVHREHEYVTTARNLYIFILSHMYVNNYGLFNKFYKAAINFKFYNPEDNKYKIAASTIPSIQTLCDYYQAHERKHGQTLFISPDPFDSMAQMPTEYWRLYRGTNDIFQPLATASEIDDLISQLNVSCKSIPRKLLHDKHWKLRKPLKTAQERNLSLINIFTQLLPEPRSTALQKPLTATHPNPIPVFCQIYKNVTYSSSSVTFHVQYKNVLNFFNLSTFHINFYTSSYA